jgi:NAD(P)-dependent dehydrogenase (short-subunit alcohol dehydrogenase family)
VTSGDDFTGRTVVVTGGARGIGAGYVRAFCRRGANVVIADVNKSDGQALAKELDTDQPGALFVPTDVADEDSTRDMAEAAIARFGRIDALVNNAAIYQDLQSKTSFDQIPAEEWDRVMAVNVGGIWRCSKAVFSHMRSRGAGRVVNIASVVSYVGTPGFAHYVASKAAVVGLTRALARELGPYGIGVNAVAPGLVANEASRTLNADDYLQAAAGTRAIAREMVPDDLVGTVIFLASSQSEFVTGQTFVVDGGGVMS